MHANPLACPVLMLRYHKIPPRTGNDMRAQGNALETGIPRKRMPWKGARILGAYDVAVPVKNRILFRPHRARTLVVDVFPGRCPGLISRPPRSGAKFQGARNIKSEARRVAGWGQSATEGETVIPAGRVLDVMRFRIPPRRGNDKL